MAKGWTICSLGWSVREALRLNAPGVLMVMAVDAQQFPVAAIEGVVVVVVVAMVDGQFLQFAPFEFPGAASADVREQFERPFSVTGLAQIFFLTHSSD